jgi:hypothetical protein
MYSAPKAALAASPGVAAGARWTQPDPLNQAADFARGNRYAYAGADPVSATDPAGTFFIDLDFEAEIGPVRLSIDASVDSSQPPGSITCSIESALIGCEQRTTAPISHGSSPAVS